MRHRARAGTARLAETIDEHVKRRAAPSYTLDLGTIQADGHLRLDRYDVSLEPGDYLVDEAFETATTRTRSGGAGDQAFAAHDHQIRAALEEGDRVIVMILDAGEDEWTPVIVGRLTSG